MHPVYPYLSLDGLGNSLTKDDMKSIERGYFKLSTDSGDKYAHFSRVFLSKFRETQSGNLVEWGKKMDNAEDPDGQFNAAAELLYAGLLAYDLEEGLESDYNIYKAENWLWDAVQNDDNTLGDLFKAFAFAMPKPSELGKLQGQK